MAHKLTHAAVDFALRMIVQVRASIKALSRLLAVGWHTVNSAIMDKARAELFNDPARFQGVEVIWVDEHRWRHSRWGDDWVTVIIDLTPVRSGRRARLLDMVPGRSKTTLETWLAAQPKQWRDGIRIAAMDGFTGYKSAAEAKLTGSVTVMDPFHVIRLIGEKMDQCRQRLQQATLGRRGRSGDPLYSIRRVLHTRRELLSLNSTDKITQTLSQDQHAALEVTWCVYQRAITAYQYQGRSARTGKEIMASLIQSLNDGLPKDALPELAELASTLKRRAADILAYWDHPHTSNGPTEAINGRIENLRGNALGFRNIINYIARCLLDTGGFRHQYAW